MDADVGLSNGDPRAAERTFQLLNQVAGRAGRGEKPGRALLQTCQPEHPVLRALLSGDFERFYARRPRCAADARLPPFGRLAAVIVVGLRPRRHGNFGRALARAACLPPERPGWSVAAPGALPGEEDIVVFGPAEAPIAMVRGKHRFRLLIKAPRQRRICRLPAADARPGPRPRERLENQRRCRSAEFSVSVSVVLLVEVQSLLLAPSVRVARPGTLCYVSPPFGWNGVSTDHRFKTARPSINVAQPRIYVGTVMVRSEPREPFPRG